MHCTSPASDSELGNRVTPRQGDTTQENPNQCRRQQAANWAKEGVGPRGPHAMKERAHTIQSLQHGRAHQIVSQGVCSMHSTPQACLRVLSIPLGSVPRVMGRPTKGKLHKGWRCSHHFDQLAVVEVGVVEPEVVVGVESPSHSGRELGRGGGNESLVDLDL